MKLLFLCTHNACRSIIAEVIAREVGHWTVASAGVAPSGQINPQALEHLARRGYKVRNLSSEAMSAYIDWHPDAVITLCANANPEGGSDEQCVTWPKKTIKIHWGMNDPSQLSDPAASEQAFNLLIDELERRLQILKALDPQTQSQLQAGLAQALT